MTGAEHYAEAEKLLARVQREMTSATANTIARLRK